MLVVDSRLRKQPSQARSRLTVDAFLEAADRVLRREGYDAASTNRLARVAGFSVGSLYQYFDDKQAVVGTLIDRELRREARDLVVELDASRGCDICEILDRAVSFLVQRRIELAHLHRTLAHHVGELSDEPPLRYARRLQSPLVAGTIQRIGSPHLMRGGDGRLEPRLGIVCQLVNTVTHRHAVEAGSHVPNRALADTLVRTLSGYLSTSGKPAADSMELVAGWRLEATQRDRHASERRPRRLQEVRTLLLRSGHSDPDLIEPAVHVGAGVYDLVFECEARPPSHSTGDELELHLARVIEALWLGSGSTSIS